VVFQCRDEGTQRAPVAWRRGNGLPLPPGTRDLEGRLELPDIKVVTYISYSTRTYTVTTTVRLGMARQLQKVISKAVNKRTIKGVKNLTLNMRKSKKRLRCLHFLPHTFAKFAPADFSDCILTDIKSI
jgi:hypothetical protein